MSNAAKAILLSAFIFPGAGQIILMRYGRGALFFLISFISGLLCVVAIVRQAVVILQRLVDQGEVVAMPQIMSTAIEAATTASTLFLKTSLFLFFCCWLAAVVDAWRIGKALDESRKEAGEGKTIAE